MVRHSTSHGLSVLVCTVLSAIIIDVVRPVTPGLISAGTTVSNFFVNTLKIPITVEGFNIVLVATILGLVWGVFFRLRYRNKYPRADLD